MPLSDSVSRHRKVFLFIFLSSFANAAPTPASLTLKAAYQAAVGRSETLADQQEQVVQAEERIKQARGSILPNINGVATYFKQDQPDNTVVSSIATNQTIVRLTGTQPLFRGGREFMALKQASTLSDAQESTKRQAELQLFNDVAQNYLTVAALERDLKNIEQERSYLEKRISELKSRVQIGRSRNTEVLTLDSSLQSILAQYSQSLGNLKIARENLAFLTGLPESTPIAGAPETIPPSSADEKTTATTEVIEARPDVKAAKLKSEAADDAVWVAKGAHLPSVDVSGNYYIRRTGSFDGVDWDVTFGLTLPIFAGGVTQSLVRTAVSQNRQGELNLSRTRRAASDELNSLNYAVASDRDQIEALTRARDSASRNYEAQTRDYRLGLVTNLDVLQSLTASQEAQRALDKLRYQIYLDILKLQTASGKLPDVAY